MKTVKFAGKFGGPKSVAVGDVAQLGERLVRNEEVGGSTPLISTNFFGSAGPNPIAAPPSRAGERELTGYASPKREQQ